MDKYKGKVVIQVTAKCSDLYSHTIFKRDGTLQAEYSGYVPSFFPDDHYGDYLMLDIEPYTGKILNWKPWKKATKKNNKKQLNKRGNK